MPKLSRRVLLPTVLGVGAMQFGTVTFGLGLSLGPASLVTSITAAYVGLTAVLAVVFLHERLTRRQGLGVAVIAAGIALVGFSSTG